MRNTRRVAERPCRNLRHSDFGNGGKGRHAVADEMDVRSRTRRAVSDFELVQANRRSRTKCADVNRLPETRRRDREIFLIRDAEATVGASIFHAVERDRASRCAIDAQGQRTHLTGTDILEDVRVDAGVNDAGDQRTSYQSVAALRVVREIQRQQRKRTGRVGDSQSGAGELRRLSGHELAKNFVEAVNGVRHLRGIGQSHGAGEPRAVSLGRNVAQI